MLMDKQTENLLMYPGVALMCVAVVYFYLAGLFRFPEELAQNTLQLAVWKAALVRETLALFVTGAALALSGWGLSIFNAWRRWTCTVPHKPGTVRLTDSKENK